MTHYGKDHQGCREYQRLSRRKFMGMSTTAAVAAGLPAWFPKISMASDNSGLAVPCPPCPIINVFGRGGWDGLSICIPYADPEYYNIRPMNQTLAYDPPGSGTNRTCSDLDGYFGWPQIMERWLGIPWQDNRLAFVHAMGYTTNHSYSHFVGQHQLEVGQPSPPPTLRTGWLGRHLESRGTPLSCQTDPILRGLALDIAKHRVMVGGVDCIATPDPANYDLTGPVPSIADRLQVLLDFYTAEGTYTEVAEQTVATIAELQKVDFDSYQSTIRAFQYPQTPIGQSMRAIAAILNNPVKLNVEAFTVDFGGWDHHSQEDPHNLFFNGRMYTRMRDLSEALGVFYMDMRTRFNLNWILNAMTEFGRTAMENASNGTDHAKGNCMFLMGGRVKGGVYGNWPGLDNLTGGGDDIPITTDVRLVFAEVIDKCLGNATNFPYIFPNYTVNPNDYLGFL